MKTKAAVSLLYSDTLTATDANADPIVLSFLSPIPAGMLLLNGVISWYPSISDTGLKMISALANDNKGGYDTLTWIIDVKVPPSIITQPSTQTVSAGQTVTFSVVVTGSTPITYQWQKDGANISGATSSSYSIANPFAANAGSYSVVASNSVGSVTSNTANLTFNVSPSISTHPLTQTVNAGQSVTFSVLATGTATLIYQWNKNGTNISGATSANFTISNTASDDAGSYTVVVINNIGSMTSNSAILTVNGVADIDGNFYQTIKIGTQEWAIENLKTTKYNDGSAIPLITDSVAWNNRTTPGYCWQKNDITNKNKYGALYNWYTINTGKLAPPGWHIPSDAEWTIMENYLIANGYNWDGTITGNKIAKSLASKTDWLPYTNPGVIGNDLSKNNRSGFSAFPAGTRTYDGSFYAIIGNDSFLWCATEYDGSSAYSRMLFSGFDNLTRGKYSSKSNGFSVRLIKD
jgi:uncharacterized protein (TIGR02145 family)